MVFIARGGHKQARAGLFAPGKFDWWKALRAASDSSIFPYKPSIRQSFTRELCMMMHFPVKRLRYTVYGIRGKAGRVYFTERKRNTATVYSRLRVRLNICVLRDLLRNPIFRTRCLSDRLTR